MVGGDYQNWWRVTEDGKDGFKASGESDLALKQQPDSKKGEAESQHRLGMSQAPT